MENPFSGEPVPVIESVASSHSRHPLENDLYEQLVSATQQEQADIEIKLLWAMQAHAKAVLMLLIGYCEDGLAWDMATRVLSKAKRGRFKGESLFSTWTHSCFRNLAKDQRGRLERRRKTEIQFWDGFDVEDKKGWGGEEYERDERERDKREETVAEAQIKVRLLMRMASPLQRELLEARMYSDSLQGAADRIGISKPAAQSRLELFRGALRRKGIEFKSRLSLYDWENSPSNR